jgi:hypothetical protein
MKNGSTIEISATGGSGYSRVVVARRRRVARRDQAVDERLVGVVDPAIERAEVVLPLGEGARAGDDRAHRAVRQHPGGGEMRRRDALLLAVRLQRLRGAQRLLAELGLHHPRVAAAGAGAGGRRRARRVLGGEHAAGDRAVGHDADAVMQARRQHLDLGLPVEQVVVRLADDRPGMPSCLAPCTASAIRQPRKLETPQ